MNEHWARAFIIGFLRERGLLDDERTSEFMFGLLLGLLGAGLFAWRAWEGDYADFHAKLSMAQRFLLIVAALLIIVGGWLLAKSFRPAAREGRDRQDG